MVAVDMSGSVSDAELELLYGELNGLAKKATFTFVPFDSAIDEENIFVWKKGKKAPPKRFRAGGTCFNAPVNWANDRRGEFDALLILTDGYAPKPGACKLRTGWIITPDGEMDFDVGNSPVIKLQHKTKGLAA
jgi:predicted metal-dependent peptidase